MGQVTAPIPPTDDASTSPRSARPSIGGYTLLRRLGEGGMGIVHLARDRSGRPVAIKIMRPELAAGPEFRRRFAREAQAAQRVAPFCTAAVLDSGVDGDQAYIVTEYVEGPDLGSLIRDRGPLTGGSLQALAVATATALVAIHAAGVVHRDLKPSNILLGVLGPKVIDFGIARLADADATRTGSVVGTPAYMAPEQANGEPITAAADVFAWGCVIAYAGTGGPPFGGGTPAEVLFRVVSRPPRLDGLDERLRPLVERALDKDPARRPTAQGLLDALLGRESAGIETATRVVGDTWTPVVAPAATLAAPVPPDRRGRRRWPYLTAALLALVAAATALVITRPWEPEGNLPGTPATTREMEIDKNPMRVQITEAVRLRDGDVRLSWALTNRGPNAWIFMDDFGRSALDYSVSQVGLTTPGSKEPLYPTWKDGACLCSSGVTSVRSGEEKRFYAVYTSVPEEAESVDVDIPRLGVFRNVSISDG
ncbi:serine/threonine-protein kinase [Microbispora maris]|uniref:serine/threonine-protein kinase n=1 Tax=Microbispora maris TaxID=3144104 RepID=UPI003D15EB3E